MNNDQDSDPTLLTFGCILAIADFKDQNSFIFSDGFLKTSVYLRSFPTINEEQNVLILFLSSLKNYSFNHCLFQVIPKLSDTNKQLIASRVRKLEGEEQSDAFDHRKRYRLPKINELLTTLLNEYKYNLDTIDKAKMAKLGYFQPFQLVHLASGRLFACHETESRYENQNYLIKLDDYTSDATVFNFAPAFRYQQDGEQDVNAEEMCIITRAIPIQNRQTQVHASAQEISTMKGNQSEELRKNSQHHLITQKKEINGTVESSHFWKIILYQKYTPENSRNLKVGDCIWLHHSEAEATLSVKKIIDMVDRNSFSDSDINRWLSKENLRVTVHSNQGSENAHDYSGGTAGLWLLEGSEFQEGGYCQFGKPYRLRHLVTGFYLQVEQIADKKTNNFEYAFSLSRDANDKSTLFTVIELKTLGSDKFAKTGSYIYLYHPMYKKWIDFQKKFGQYKTILKNENERTEHAVFKIHIASKNNIWEINFLLSCFRMICKFLKSILSPHYPGIANFETKKNYLNKIKKITKCINELGEFCKNRLYTTSPDQLYGNINPNRQKLMKEQFYIDVVVRILNRVIMKSELEFYQKQPKDSLEDDKFINFLDDDEEEEQKQKEIPPKDRSIEEKYNYVASKIQLCEEIYNFLGIVCKQNNENQIYTFELIPYFQIQAKYLPTAIDAIIEIVSSNKQLLYKLSSDLKIDYDFQQGNERKEETKQIKILINLYESEKDNQDNPAQQENIQFKQHEKITSKPINLINYFINLIWDDEAINNSDYLKFLRSVCRFENEPIQINQENIFKLYKRYNDIRPKLGVETKAEEIKQSDGTVRLMSKAGQLIIPSDCNIQDGQFNQYNILKKQKQLTFFSEVCQGRNYLWKKELGAQFEKSFLFRNIWNQKPMDERYESLKPCFAKIALSLYIDQDPLKSQKLPNLCCLFSECDKPIDFIILKSTVDNAPNIQELNTFYDLTQNMIEYFSSLYLHEIKREIDRFNDNRQEKQIEQNQDSKSDMIGDDILKNELIPITCEILDKIINLQLFWILEYSFNKGIETKKTIAKMVQILLYIFQYEKFQVKFVNAHAQTFSNSVITSREVKNQKNKLVNLNMMNMMNFPFAGKQGLLDEDENDEAKDSQQLLNEKSLFSHPIMRGYLKFVNQLEKFNYMDPKYIENELDVKLKICNIFDRLLDLRQNFLIQNTLIFFKRIILQGKHEEHNEKKMRRKFRRERKNYDELSEDQKNLMIIRRLLKSHQLGLLPNTAKTGIKDVDYPKADMSHDPFSSFKKLKNIHVFKSKQKKNCINYLDELEISGIPEVLDLDQYLSLGYDDPNPYDKPIAAILPTLLNNFMLITDQKLEKSCIGLIMRIFNQKSEFKENLQKMQLIFDQEKIILYQFIEKYQQQLRLLVTQSDLWFSKFIYASNIKELEECHFIIENITRGLHKNIILQDGNIIENSEIIDNEKQVLVFNMGVYQIIIDFIREGMNYFNDLILNPDVAVKKKEFMIQTFEQAFKFLNKFCSGNFNNQLIVFEHLDCIISFLQYDLGQIELIREIFRDNKQLLVQKVSPSFVGIFISQIEKEGRQEYFLDIFEDIMRYKGKQIFDNQLLVLNALLPNEINDRVIKILYADDMKEKEVKFFLEDNVYSQKDHIFKKLQILDFQDTFRDEPFLYHRRLLDILLQTTYVDVSKKQYDPLLSQESIKDNFNISIGKLKKYFKARYLLELLKVPDSMTRTQKDEQDENYLQILEYPEKRNLNQKATKDDLFINELLKSPVKLEKYIKQINSEINQKNGFKLLKFQLIDFLRQVHIASERGGSTNSELYFCSMEVAELYEFENRRLDKITSPNQVDKALGDYYMLGLLPFAITYFQRFIQKQIESQQGDDERKDFNIIKSFANKFLIKLKLMPELLPFIDNKQKAMILLKFYEIFPTPLWDRMMNQSKQSEIQKDQSDQMFIQRIDFFISEKKEMLLIDSESPQNFQLKSEISEEPLLQTSKVKQEQKEKITKIEESKIKKKQKHDKKTQQKKKHQKNQVYQMDEKYLLNDDEQKLGFDAQKALTIENYWKQFLQELLENDTFYSEQKKEREAIANAIINIQSLLDPKYSKGLSFKPDVKMVSKKLIFFLQYAFNDIKCHKTIEILLIILKNIIEKEEDKKKKTEMQNLYDRLGATQMVLLVLSDNSKYTDKKMLMIFLVFINTLLDGGNHQVQISIFEHMINNPASEQIFAKIYNLIKKQIENTETIAKYKKSQVGGAIDMLNIDEKECAEDQRLIDQVLKFLQNSVEGHYLELQNYLRFQTNSRTNYDIIIAVTDLLKTYYYEDCTYQNYDNMIKCLDTLNELVQGPCPENQIAVTESKFFDIAVSIFEMKSEQNQNVFEQSEKDNQNDQNDQNEKQKVQTQFDQKSNQDHLSPWMISRLQNKVLMLILSLLEGREINENNQVLKRIMTNLPLIILEKHLAEVYKNYRIIYGNQYILQCLEHLTKDPRNLKEQELKIYHPLYFQTILQNGFLIFFLICYFMECDPLMESPVVKLHKQFKKNILKKDDSGLAQLLFKQSILGQLLDFVTSVINSFLSIFKQMNTFLGEQLKQKENLSAEDLEKKLAEEYRQNLKEAVNFYLTNSAHIDVAHGEKLEIVYFILLPYTKYLPKEKKIIFHNTVDRSTTQTKVQNLINESDNFIEVCKHEESLILFFQKQKFLALFTNYVKLWQEIAFYLTLFLNIFILFSFTATYGGRVSDYVFFNDDQNYSPQQTKSMIYSIGIAMTCCSIFVVSYFLLKNAPLILRSAWRRKGIFEDQHSNIIFWSIDQIYKLTMVLVQFLQEVEVMYYIAYGSFAVLGTIIHPFFFIFHLSEILFRYPTLKNIIYSVWQPKKQLILTVFFFVILNYIYAILGYTFLSEQFSGYCDTMLYCLMTCFEWTIRSSIGTYISDYTGVNNVTEVYGFGRFFYDNTSNIILCWIMLNIIGGIIIDTFGSLREEEYGKLRDKEDNCFICGNLKALFDRNSNSGGFREHIKINHYMWNYLFFIAYLRQKDETEYSGIESFVASRLSEDDLSWIPFNQARELAYLQDLDQQKEGQLIEGMQQRVNKLANIQDLFKDMSRIIIAKNKGK